MNGARVRPNLALLLLIPIPSIGVLANGTLAESDVSALALLGLAIWALCKVWIIVFPAYWHSKIDGGQYGFSKLPEGSGIRPWAEGFGIGFASAVEIGADSQLEKILIAQDGLDMPETLACLASRQNVPVIKAFLASLDTWSKVST